MQRLQRLLSCGSLALLFAALSSPHRDLDAQDMRPVNGRVFSAETNQPLTGVQVYVKGTRIGTLTDARGAFSLSVPRGSDELVFSHLGYRTLVLAVEPDMEVALSFEVLGIEGITVAALGLRREKISLGYAVQDLNGETLNRVPELNLVNSLKGNIAGVQITNAGPTGGSARIVIRGANSIAGENQPLFILDGTPVSNSYDRNEGYGGIDYGNAIQDIDPSNIENISVLKGPAAAALYGSRAANGAVVITTKSGSGSPGGRMGVTVRTSLTFETPLRLPDYQNRYGQGYFGEFKWVDGLGGGLWDHFDESWGPRMDGQPIDQFTGPGQPFLPNPGNVRSFFETGSTWNTSVSVSKSGENSNVRLGVSNMSLNGMSPGNTMERIGVALKGRANVTERLSAEASVNYIDQGARNRPGTGYDEDNPMQSFVWFGRQVDMNALRHYRCTGNEPTPCTIGGQYNWNYSYHNNPYWEALVNTNADERERVIGHVSLDYQINDWISANARVGRDWSRDHRKRNTEFYSLDDAGDGGFAENTIYSSLTNLDVLVNATRDLNPDFTLDVTAGGNLLQAKLERADVAVSKLTVPSLFTIDNAAVNPLPTDFLRKAEQRSLYGSVSLNYRGYLNVDVTGRNDWSSTLPADNNSYFYPSVSTAFVFTDALNLDNRYLSSGKLRASWTRVGNDAEPYQLTAVYNAQTPWGQTPMFAVPNELPNINLKPEETTAWEAGADLGFFDERLGFVLTRYDRTTRNQILGVQVSRASGYASQRLNAGEVRNWGWELLLQANPVRMENGLRWFTTINWSKNRSEVTKLHGDLETLVLGSYWSLNIEARKGEPYGVMFGNTYLRCRGPDYEGCTKEQEGLALLDEEGKLQVDPVRRVLGNYNPDWIGGIQNRFAWGPFDLSVLVDGQRGGDVFSATNWLGEYTGVLHSTLEGREEDWCTPGYLNEGVLPDGRVNGVDADVRICSQDRFEGNWGIHSLSVDDATYVKLREVRLAYELPDAWMSRLGFSGGNVALIGSNLLLWAPNIDNIDPETAFDASNVQGIEFGQFPSARSFGLSFTITP